MRGMSVRFSACCAAAALGCLVSPVLPAQTLGIALEQVQVGLERATRLPLEIVRLQADVQADMWKSPALAQLMPDCARLGTPKEGCALARFNVTGGGKVFLVAAPEAPSSDLVPVPAGRLVLAPGGTVQLVAAGFPSIQVEIKAPADQPLYLGELASSEVGRILSLLVPQPGVSATAADVRPQGKIALRAKNSPDPTQLASANPTATTPATMPVAVKGTNWAQPLAAADGGEILLLDNMPRAVAEKIEVAAVMASEPTGVLILDTMPRAVVQPVQVASIAVPEPLQVLMLDSMPAAIARRDESPAMVAEAPADILVLDLMPVAIAASPEPASVVADAREVLLLDAMPAAVEAAPETTIIAEKPAVPAPILVAAAPAPGATPALSADLARLRAEVEAEVARENARFARQLQAAPAKSFRFGT